MKRIITLFLTLSLCLSLTSCGNFAMVRYNPYVSLDAEILFDSKEIPDHSDNFDEDFFDSFEEDYVFASNLAYYSASEWEAEQECDHESARVRYRFSMIDGAEDKTFVARSTVNRSKFPALADVVCHLEVFRHKNSPDPMKDWTIKSISVVVTEKNQSPFSIFCENATDAKAYDGNMLTLEELATAQMSIFGAEGKIVCTFDREHDSEFMDAFAESYHSPYRTEEWSYYLDHSPNGMGALYVNDYYLIVRFEENDNIVWCAQLAKDHYSTELYSASAKGGAEQSVIRGEYAEKIFNAIKERNENK